MTNITKILFIFHIEIYSENKHQHQLTKQPFMVTTAREKKKILQIPKLAEFLIGFSAIQL
jgi:hypothetical protein